MGGQLTIVGLGEALLVEHPDRTEAAGLAAAVARASVRLGHCGIAISRVGQDRPADALLALLAESGVDTTHIQRDPDLPTGRVIVRPAGGRIERYLDERAAFDNLQSDFDLEDVAQQADAVVFGLLTRRGGQTRSQENRFLEACGVAVKLFDLTNRADGEIDRGPALSGLELADAALVDPVTLRALRHGPESSPWREAALRLLHDASLAFVITAEPAGNGGEDGSEERVTLHAQNEYHGAEIPATRLARGVFTVTLLAAIVRGRPHADGIDLAARVAAHVIAHPSDPMPEDWLSA